MKLFSVDKSVNAVISWVMSEYNGTAVKCSDTESKYLTISKPGYKKLKVRVSDHMAVFFSCDIFIQPVKSFPWLYSIHYGLGSDISFGTLSHVKSVIKKALENNKKSVQDPQPVVVTQAKKETAGKPAVKVSVKIPEIKTAMPVVLHNVANANIPDAYSTMKFRKSHWNDFYKWYCANIFNAKEHAKSNAPTLIKTIYTKYNYSVAEIEKIIQKYLPAYGVENGLAVTIKILKMCNGNHLADNNELITDKTIERYANVILCKNAIINDTLNIPEEFADASSVSFQMNKFIKWYEQNGINLHYDAREKNVRDQIKLSIQYCRYTSVFHNTLVKEYKTHLYAVRTIGAVYEAILKVKRAEDKKIEKLLNDPFFRGFVKLDDKWNLVTNRAMYFNEWCNDMSKMFPWIKAMSDNQRLSFKNLSLSEKAVYDSNDYIRIVEFLMIAHNVNKTASLECIFNTAMHIRRISPTTHWDFDNGKQYVVANPVNTVSTINHQLPVVSVTEVPAKIKENNNVQSVCTTFVYHKQPEKQLEYDLVFDDFDSRMKDMQKLVNSLKKDIPVYGKVSDKIQNEILSVFAYDISYADIVKYINENSRQTKMIKHACYILKTKYKEVAG